MKNKYALISLVIYIFIIDYSMPYLIIASGKKQIDSGLLKYDRQKAIKYAMDYWNWTAPGYFNFGSKIEDPDREDEEFPVILDERDCSFYNVQIGYKENGEPDCGGDCTNFVCQCLIAGGIPAKKLVNGACKVEYQQINPTILTAQCLVNQLLKMGAYDNINNKIISNGTSNFTLNDLDLGDVGIFNNPYTHSAIIGEIGNDEATVGVYAHSLSRYPNATNYKGKIGYYFKSFAYQYILFHISDVPVITAISLFEEDEKGKKVEYYSAYLDENKNNGDGEICPAVNKRNTKTLIPLINMNVQLKIDFNNAIDVDNKKHSVKLVNYENSSDNESKKTVKATIVLKNPVLSNDEPRMRGQVLLFE